ncbi:MAG: glycoside hydrolase family 95 protein [Oscillospiraceae bacterium]|nr:glycoside hydrolase family 95 protein [Oscillospiraceae bacterium]
MPKMWYRHPAACFEEALPVGAGRFGAMLYGEAEAELVRLNEDSLWSGGPRERINPDAKESLGEIRRLILNGQIAEAETLAFQKMQGCPKDMRHYTPLGDLTVRLSLPDGEVTDYLRTLDLSSAAYSVTFRKGGALFSRAVFASHPAQCIILHFTGEQPFSAVLSMDGRDDDFDRNCVLIRDTQPILVFDGCSGGANGIAFCAAIRVIHSDGKVYRRGNTIVAENVHEMTAAISMHSGYYHPDADLLTLCDADCLRASALRYSALSTQHTADYRALFDRVSLTLPDAELTDRIPTDTLLESAKAQHTDACNALLALYFHFGRYLMISGSRPDSLPLNLQGIWNVDMWPAWGSRYTVNINTQMNYWCAESCNLSECHLPLFTLLRKVMENGKQTAREMYGCEGFCCHHNTDLWGDTAPQDLWMPATLWATGGAWLSLHIMEHYRYTGDLAFLRENYDIMYQAALFCSQYLIENKQEQLVTCPSVSPENTYQLPNGATGSLCAGTAMDSQIITELYTAVIEADALLGLHSGLIPLLRVQLPKLPQPTVGQHGQIMEWAEDYDEPEPGHRHISQLFALHPAHRISPRTTPMLADAAAATLQRRLAHGCGHTGWSCAWIANFYARLQDSAHLYEMLCMLLCHSTNPNLFDMHPPFQIDGNFGGTSAITEAMLQSAPDGLTLLPALPAEWHTGSFHGLCGYGGFTLSAKWQNMKLTDAAVTSKNGGVCRLYYPANTKLRLRESDFMRKEAEGFLEFETIPAGVYHLTAV